MKMRIKNAVFGLLACVATTALSNEQPRDAYVEDGVLRWPSGEEVALFGVNYNAPFAFTYRAIERVGATHEAAIIMDVAHLKRLGVDAYRVHLWDREISDLQGNLLENEHLRLFDFLVAELKRNDIKIIVTAIGWWGSGYPEPDPIEPGFSTQYSKPEMNQKRTAVEAQKRYITQLLNHTNGYTRTTLINDSDVVAIELFNEPKHHGTPAQSAAYIEELAAAARATGLKKPVFYNIAEQGNQQKFAAAVCDSSIDGIGYQWYPTGLVHYATLQGNLLPTVQRYTDVFANTGNCKQKARMVYEFDAADTARSVMYPAMARSFREAGFQWATLFSYDPAVTAHTNAEYNTHYLNLLYTPEKAISFLIAGEVFRTMPRYQKTPAYPANNTFGAVTLDYHQNLSLLNTSDRLYYSNHTDAQPKNAKALQHVAGVGSSPVVQYDGSGTYFLDKLSENAWQLEVYPDVQRLSDPHANSSLRREVGRLYPRERTISVRLPGLGERFHVQPVNDLQPVNEKKAPVRAKNGSFRVSPGVYVLSRTAVDMTQLYAGSLPQYILPHRARPEASPSATVWHQPLRSLQQGGDLSVPVQVGSINAPDTVELLVRYKGEHRFTAIPMQAGSGGWYRANLADAEELERPGPLEYAVVVHHGSSRLTFPGGSEGSPQDWDFVQQRDYWTTVLKPSHAPITLFDPATDKNNVIYPQNGEAQYRYTASPSCCTESGSRYSGAEPTSTGITLQMEASSVAATGDAPLALLALADDSSLSRIAGPAYNTVVMQWRSLSGPTQVSFGVLDAHGLAYSTSLTAQREWQTVSIPLNALNRSSTLLPKAYPMFMPAKLNPDAAAAWPADADPALIQGVQFAIQSSGDGETEGAAHGIEVGKIQLLARPTD